MLSLSSNENCCTYHTGLLNKKVVIFCLADDRLLRSILCFPRNTNSIYPSCIWEQQMFVISRPFLRKTNFFWTKYWHYSSLIYKRWILYLYGVNKICLRHLMAASFYNCLIMIEIDGNLSWALFYNSWLRLQICVVANIKQSENTVIRLKM